MFGSLGHPDGIRTMGTVAVRRLIANLSSIGISPSVGILPPRPAHRAFAIRDYEVPQISRGRALFARLKVLNRAKNQ